MVHTLLFVFGLLPLVSARSPPPCPVLISLSVVSFSPSSIFFPPLSKLFLLLRSSLSHVIVLTARDESGEMVACGVKEMLQTVAVRVLSVSLSHLSPIQCICWGSHRTVLFIFTSVCFFVPSFSLPHPFISLSFCSCTTPPPVVVSFLMGGPGWSLLSERGGRVQLASKCVVC